MEILLIAAEWYESCQALIHQKCTVILSEGSLVKEAEGCHAVYKYQSVENILRELMYYSSGQDTEGMYIEESRKDNRVIGIFSPVSGSESNSVCSYAGADTGGKSECFISEHGRVFRNGGVHGGKPLEYLGSDLFSASAK